MPDLSTKIAPPTVHRISLVSGRRSSATITAALAADRFNGIGDQPARGCPPTEYLAHRGFHPCHVVLTN